jgi:hypothetical protein
MNGVEAMRVAHRTAKRLEGRRGHELSEQELENARSFKDLILLEFNDRQQSRAVLARAMYEADHLQKGSKRTTAYMELLAEQLNCTRQLVESLKFVTDRWVCGFDGRYVRLTGVSGRARRLQKRARRLQVLQIWLKLQMLLRAEPA